MACCWDGTFKGSTGDTKTWVQDHSGWRSFLESFDLQEYLSGFPRFPSVDGSTDMTLVFRSFADAWGSFVNHSFDAQCDGEFSTVAYSRSRVIEDFGGLVPVLFFIVPDYYINYPALLYKDKFQFTTALNYTGDVNVSIPEQVKMGDPFFLEWRTWRDTTPGQGVPNDELPPSISEDDIDIVLEFVRLPNVQLAGGRVSLLNFLLDNGGGRCVSEFRLSKPPRDPDLAGLATPKIYLERTEYLAARTTGDFNFSSAAVTAGPAPEVNDDSILAGFNRLYPNNNEELIQVSVNGEDLNISELDRDELRDVIFSRMRFIPPQLYANPNSE